MESNQRFISLLSVIAILCVKVIISQYNSINQNCKWEGQKIPHANDNNRLFLCHFYAKTNTWLTFPFRCVSAHYFDDKMQRCTPIQSLHRRDETPGYSTYGYFTSEITEIPDFQYIHKNFRKDQESDDLRRDSFQKMGTPSNQDSSNQNYCGESLKILAVTIKSMGDTIRKISDKSSIPSFTAVPSVFNTSFIISFSNFSEIVHPQRENEKAVPNNKKIDVGDQHELNRNTIYSIPTSTISPLDMTKRHPTNSLNSNIIKNPFHFGHLGKGEQHETLKPAIQAPGNNLFDFLFKNIYKSSPTHLPVHNIFPTNATRSPTYGAFKPLPFRPRPQLFNPTRFSVSTSQPPQYSISPEKPSSISPQKPTSGTFVNFLSFLNRLEEDILKSSESEDEDSEENNNGNIITHKPNIPVTVVTETPSNSYNSFPVTSSSISSTLSTSTGNSDDYEPTTTTRVIQSLHSTERHEDDENEDDPEDPLRLNNRKPRRV